mmetsp:Transcript_11836/g.31973  ORF Transcript_11836/g.31973 Transcript_11836/m.31973 type:complete len:115 (+) Transcript_11836:3951-4295(+)
MEQVWSVVETVKEWAAQVEWVQLYVAAGVVVFVGAWLIAVHKKKSVLKRCYLFFRYLYIVAFWPLFVSFLSGLLYESYDRKEKRKLRKKQGKAQDPYSDSDSETESEEESSKQD